MNEMMFKTSKLLKYDVMASFIFVLILSFLSSFKVALIFLLGLMVSIVNLYLSNVIMDYVCKNDKKWILYLSYFIRIVIIAALAVPFSKNLIQLIAYLGGYVLHLVILVIYGIINLERK